MGRALRERPPRHHARRLGAGQRPGDLRPRPAGRAAPRVPHAPLRRGGGEGEDPRGRARAAGRRLLGRGRGPHLPPARSARCPPRAGGPRRGAARHRDAARGGAGRHGAGRHPGASHGARRLLRRDGAEARGSRGGDLRPRRTAVQHQLHEAAPGGPLHVAEARARAAHADGILHRHGRAGGARRAGPGARADPRAPQALEAEVDVRRQPAAPGERGHGPGAHALRADRRGHGTPLEQGPQPPEHPRPRGGRPAHPPCVRARAGQRLRQRGLRAGRARDPRVPFGRPDTAREPSRPARTCTARPPRSSSGWPRTR